MSRSRVHPGPPQRAGGLTACLAAPGLFLLLALGCGGSAPVADGDGDPSGPLSVRASVDRAEVASGDRVRLVVEVDYASDHRVMELELGEQIGGLEVLERGRNVLRTVRGRTGLIDWFLLRPPTAGSYVIAPIEVVAVAPDGGQVRQSTDEVFVEVASRLDTGEGSEGLRGLKPPVEPPARWPWVLAGGGLVALILLWWWWRRRGARHAEDIVLAPHELAFAELEALRGTDFTDLAELRRYYYELSAVLRRYVEGRFGLNATDLTSQEIRARLAELGLHRPQETQLERFFVASDGVKYAAVVPSEQEVESVYEAVLSFVEETAPKPTEDDGSDAESPAVGPAPARQDGPGLEATDRDEGPPAGRRAEPPDARFRP